MSQGAKDGEATEMGRTTGWDEDTSPRVIADFLPRSPRERWLELGLRLLVVALLCGWFFMPRPGVDARGPAPQTTPR
ncbi:hypothetical protein [Bosea sp. 124]|uniref:hypothetical protein n=1 Tax=Bosea sp. 124 TaxID=2135642 RepID=UPI000D3C414D|nr:hypothetical protein [Bosea sp. 124]PTM43401.1 hypothetical protein C8D03_5016 [Bosea sp. 124]